MSAPLDNPSRRGGIANEAPNALVGEVAVPWKDVWAAMKRSGWSWKGGSGIMTDYYYIKPKCRVKGGLSGRDYFVRVKDAMEFARDCYGWHNNALSLTSRVKLLSRIEYHTRHCGKRVPPLLGVDEGNMMDKYTPLLARGGGGQRCCCHR